MNVEQIPLNDPSLRETIAIIHRAIVDHCSGGDLWICSAIAASKIEASHRAALAKAVQS